jgi:hypothetical protein
VIVAAVACLPLLARAEGKCNDDPFPLKDGTLAVAWTIPVPAAATVAIDPYPNSLMQKLDADFPAEPEGFPPSYSTNVQQMQYADPSNYPISAQPPPAKVEKLGDEGKQDKWLKDLKLVGRDPGAVPITKKYFEGNKHVLFGVVLGHPPAVDKGRDFKLCTCILQRAVVVWDDKDKKEYLWVRSRFRSGKPDGKHWVTFEPADPIQFTFDSPNDIWFPLQYNEALPDPPAFLALDVVTRKALSIGDVPQGFVVENLGQVPYKGENWYAARLRKRFEKRERQADLSIKPPQ